MFFTILALTTVLASATNIPANEESKPKDLLCDICLDIVRDLDEWITSDSTLDEIIQFVEGVRIYYLWFSVAKSTLHSQMSVSP